MYYFKTITISWPTERRFSVNPSEIVIITIFDKKSCKAHTSWFMSSATVYPCPKSKFVARSLLNKLFQFHSTFYQMSKNNSEVIKYYLKKLTRYTISHSIPGWTYVTTPMSTILTDSWKSWSCNHQRSFSKNFWDSPEKSN